MKPKEVFLLGLCFSLGIITMALEVSGFRILAPYFGYSVYVSGGLIGVIMIAMSVGYYLGGSLCGKRTEIWLRRLILISTAFFLIFILVYKYLLNALIKLGEVGGAAVSSLILFAPSMLLLSAITPMVISLVSKKGKEGVASSNVYAISTIGSVVGVFLATFVLIPFLGTRLMLNICLIALVLIDIILYFGSKLMLPFLVIAMLVPFAVGNDSKGGLFYKDSPYNLVRVYVKNGEYFLMLNQPQYVHSEYHPGQVLSKQYYDFFNLAPFLLDRQIEKNTSFNLLILGMGAGTSVQQFKYFFPNSNIDAVEIDPVVIQVGKDYFGIGNLSGVETYAEDGRPFAKNSKKTYDIVEVDVYTGGPYAPFYMMTQEFFQELSRTTASDGIVIMNLYLIKASSPAAHQYLDSVVATLGTSFPLIYTIPLGDNFIIFASKRQLSVQDIHSILSGVNEKPGFEDLGEVVGYAMALGNVPAKSGAPILTDDNAPVEQYTHNILAES